MDRRLFLSLAGGALAAPRLAHALPLVPAPRRLHLLNAHTGDVFDGFYRDASGPIARVMNELDVFLRDFHSDSEIRMDVGVVDFLAAVMESVGATQATILSAYRTRATNEMLARTTFGVAEHSQHIYGRALDIHVDNLAAAMKAARGMKRGGVGWYPRSGFIHIDTGPVRNWNLDEGGLSNLLLAGGRFRIDAHGELLVSGPGRLIVGGGHAPVVLRGRRPLTVRQRLSRLHQLARAEFLARRH